MLKVLQINRDARAGSYTFEQLFTSIEEELSNVINIRKVSVPSGLSYLGALRWAKKLPKDYDVYHLTGDVNYLAWAFNPKKTVITVHDLGHYLNTLNGIRKGIYKKVWLDFPLKKVARIHAISNFTRDQLVEFLEIESNKITVIHNPLLRGFQKVTLPTNEIPIIMQIGSGVNKNLESLISAVRGLNVKLLLLNRLSNELKFQLKTHKIVYEQRSDLNFSDLLKAYADCDLLYFASYYEGFGMPIIEAQATGRPVITSKVAAMPEVTQGDYSACLVDPLSVEEIRRAIIRLVEDKLYTKKLIENGLRNIERFKLRDISRQYVKMYESIKEG